MSNVEELIEGLDSIESIMNATGNLDMDDREYADAGKQGWR